MNLKLSDITRKTVVDWCLFSFIINTILSVILWKTSLVPPNIIRILVFNQTIGLLQLVSVIGSLLILNPKKPILRLPIVFIMVVIGSVAGNILSFLMYNIEISNAKTTGILSQSIAFSIMFGLLIYLTAFFWERVAIAKRIIEDARLKRIVNEKKIIETSLKLLQAQIEPHFLFNTLSNILSLFDSDTTKAKEMQKDLIHYLRSSLTKIRQSESTIGLELELIQSYLNIFKIRMGKRLDFSIDIAQNLLDKPFPSMLIQPIVENAIKHGLEPKLEGGTIKINIRMENDRLLVEIADTGIGFTHGSKFNVGISNICERIELLYGNCGQLLLKDNKPSGLKVVIEIAHDHL